MDVFDESGQTKGWRIVSTWLLAVPIVACIIAIPILHLANSAAGVDTGLATTFTMALGLGATGLLLTQKVPGNPIGWLMVAAGTANAVMGLGREWAVFVATGGHDFPGAAIAAWFGTWPNVVSLATLPVVLILFPSGRLPSPKWRPVVGAVVILMVMGVAGEMFTAGPFTQELPDLVNPFGIDWSGIEFMGMVGQIGFMAAIVVALASLVVRTRQADRESRQQLRWVVLGSSILCLTTFVGLLPFRGGDAVLAWVSPLSLAIFLGTVAVAVLRYRLWDLDLLIRMSLVYGSLIAMVTAAYFAVVAGFGLLADEQLKVGPSLVAAAVGAAAFALLRDRVQRRVERLFYGDRGNPYRALSKLGERLDLPVPVDDILDEVVEDMADSLRLGRIALVDANGAELAVAGSTGGSGQHSGLVADRSAGSGQVTVHDLMFRDTMVGRLVVTARPGTRLRGAELRILSDLARPVAAVVHAMSVTDELQRSRRELVTAREAERRKVRRNLHDGLGPALAAVRMKLDSAAMLLDTKPDAAKAVIDQLGADIRSTISEIRRLVYDLQPPELDEIGLLASISEQARSFSGPLEGGQMLHVEFLAPESLGTLPAAVEVAAYRIVCEALANVARHSSASLCRVELSVSDVPAIVITIDDDGIGLPDDLTRGVGTLSMLERSVELGGTLRVDTSPLGGTRVAASLPVFPNPVEADVPTDFRAARSVL